jgi:hypothetical protein
MDSGVSFLFLLLGSLTRWYHCENRGILEWRLGELAVRLISMR